MNINVVLQHGNTCLHFASDKGSVDIVTYLLDKGAQPRLLNKVWHCQV